MKEYAALLGWPMRSLVRRNVAMTVVRQVLAALAQLLVVVVVARVLGPEGNGLYSMAVLLPSILVNFLGLGVGPATVYYLARGDYSGAEAFRGNLLLGAIVASVGSLIALIIIFEWGGEIFPGVPNNLLFIGLASFPIALVSSYLVSIFQGLEDFRSFNLSVLAPQLVNLASVAVALLLLDLGIHGALAAYVVGQGAGLVIALLLLRWSRVNSRARHAAPSRRIYGRKVLGYGWKVHFSNVLGFINYRADIFLVNFLLSPVAVGIYVISVQIAERLWIISQATSTVLLPRLSSLHGQKNTRRALAAKGFLVVAGSTAMISVVVAIGLYWLIPPVFGEEFRGAYPVFLWLVPGIVAGSGARIYANLVAAAGKPEWNLYASVVVIALNIVGNILLIPALGLTGAAIATTVAYCVNLIIKLLMVRRL